MNLKTYPEICPSCSGTGTEQRIALPKDYDPYGDYIKEVSMQKVRTVNCSLCEGSGLTSKHVTYKPYKAGVENNE